MPRLTRSVPSYRKHRASGQAVVTLSGVDHYLGPHGAKASKLEYDRLIGEWLASGSVLDQPQRQLTVTELIARYWRFAKTHYPEERPLHARHVGDQGGPEVPARMVRR